MQTSLFQTDGQGASSLHPVVRAAELHDAPDRELERGAGVGGLLNTVQIADCIEFMQALPDACVDAVIADLPYGTTACAWDAVIPFDSLWGAVRRVLKPCGAVVLTASQPFTTDLIASNRKWFKYCWVWDKKITSGFMRAKRQPMKAHEDVCVSGEGELTYNPQMERRTDEELKRLSRNGKNTLGVSHYPGTVNNGQKRHECAERHPSSVLRIDGLNNQDGERVGHATQKPVKLMRYLVRTYTNPGDVVLDMCCGSGTTLLAAKQEGRHYIGCDREAEYVAIARQRLDAEFSFGPLGGGGRGESVAPIGTTASGSNSQICHPPKVQPDADSGRK